MKKYNIITIYLASILTFGIYYFYIIATLLKDINRVCEGDGQTTADVFKYIIFNLLTIGVYGLYWHFAASFRLANYHKYYSNEDYYYWPQYILFLRIIGFFMISDYLLFKMMNNIKIKA